MIRAGFETTDPRTHTRTVLVKAAEETGGRGWVLEVHCPAGAPLANPVHVHETWVETFEILEGTFDVIARKIQVKMTHSGQKKPG